MLSEQEINDILKEKYNNIILHYKEERILGIFIYGPVNYGTAIDKKDIYFEAAYLPTFEEMCLYTLPIEEEYAGVNIIDFRLFYNYTQTSNHEITEALYTDYYIVNPRYKALYENRLRAKRDEISNIEMPRRIYHAAITALDYLNDYEKTKNSLSLYKGYRLYNSCMLHSMGVLYEKCINPADPLTKNLLYNLKNKPDNFTQEQKDEYFNIAKTGCLDFINQTWDFDNSKINDNFKEAIFDIMELSMLSKQQIINFVNNLTPKEKNCLKAITYIIGLKGNINISKLVVDIGITRPVFNKLLEKLKREKIAIVENSGTHGTYIEFKINIIDFF